MEEKKRELLARFDGDKHLALAHLREEARVTARRRPARRIRAVAALRAFARFD